jgi:LPS sulfotransferase NodH
MPRFSSESAAWRGEHLDPQPEDRRGSLGVAALRTATRRVHDRLPRRHSDAVARAVLWLRSLRGSAAYRKFVIVGIARTGSTLLVDLLNAHSQVQAFGELFRSLDAVGWDVRPFATYQSPRLLALYRNDPIAFLERSVFRRWPAEYAAVGFKLFYHHARRPPHSRLWDYLSEDSSIGIIHVKRANMLAQYCSLQMAHRTNQWSSDRVPMRDPPPIRLEIDACREHFTAVRAWEEECALLFKSHEIIDVRYEELVAHRDREMRAVQEFLGLRHEPVGTRLVRQRRRPLSQGIANYEDLKRAFANTRWAGFFDDGAD